MLGLSPSPTKLCTHAIDEEGMTSGDMMSGGMEIDIAPPVWQQVHDRLLEFQTQFEAHYIDKSKLWTPTLHRLIPNDEFPAGAFLLQAFIDIAHDSVKSLKEAITPELLLEAISLMISNSEAAYSDYCQDFSRLYSKIDTLNPHGIQAGRLTLLEWSHYPLQYIRDLKDILAPVQKHPMLKDAMKQLNQLSALERIATIWCDAYVELRILGDSIDCSKARSIETEKIIGCNLFLPDPSPLASRRLMAEETFSCISYDKTVNNKSTRQPMTLALLNDQLLILAPIEKSKARSPSFKFTLLYPPVKVNDFSFRTHPDHGCMENLFELIITGKRLFLLQASSTLIKHEWSGHSTLGGIESTTLAESPHTAPASLGTGASTVGPTSIIAETLAPKTPVVRLNTKAIQPPISLVGTTRISKTRRCKVWMMRHNIEGELRWMREELATIEVRRVDPPADSSPPVPEEDEMDIIPEERLGRPFILLYEERPSPWDDREAPALASLWLLPETQLERSGPSRLFIHNRYCIEFPTRRDSKAALQVLDSERARMAALGPTDIIAITGTVLSIGRVTAYLRRGDGSKGTSAAWEELGVCQAEFQSTTTQCSAFSLAMAGSSRRCFQAWVHPDTSTRRIDSRNLLVALPAADSSARLILLRSRDPLESVAIEDCFVVAKKDAAFKASDSFVSCYGPDQEQEEPIFDGIAKVFRLSSTCTGGQISAGNSILIGLGRLYVHLRSSDGSRRVFLVSTELHEEIWQTILPAGPARCSVDGLSILLDSGEGEGRVEIKVRAVSEVQKLRRVLFYGSDKVSAADTFADSGRTVGTKAKRGRGDEMEEGVSIDPAQAKRVETNMCEQMDVDMEAALSQIAELTIGSSRGIGHLAAVMEEEDEEEMMSGRGKSSSFATPAAAPSKGQSLTHKRSRTSEGGAATLRPVASSDSLSSVDGGRGTIDLFGAAVPGGIEKDLREMEESNLPKLSDVGQDVIYACPPVQMLSLFGLGSREDLLKVGISRDAADHLLHSDTKVMVPLEVLIDFIHTNSISS